jgi:aspartate carbamoyltransferase catalytic subunit
MSLLSVRHLIGLRGLPKEDLDALMATSLRFRELLDRPVKKVPSLKGMTVLNLFFENSTRTKISFELAEKRLSADTVGFSSAASSIKKGETLLDTVKNIEAMKIDMMVVRHAGAGVPKLLADHTSAQIINAGDGANEHPTQALLDMFSMTQVLGDLKGAKVAIVGDVRHSRVVRSNVYGLRTMGVEVVLCAPPTLLPRFEESLGVKCTSSLEEAVRGADVVMTLRLQKERMADGLLPSDREYRTVFGITKEKMEMWNPNAYIMHPGPINRNIELDSDLADSKKSLVLDQVTNGVASRMAVLYLLAGGERA